ncbi:hypothetical protein [Streptomyces sp. NPDC002758]
MLTAEELAEVQENMTARMLARREERERQARTAEIEADREAVARYGSDLFGWLVFRLDHASGRDGWTRKWATPTA